MQQAPPRALEQYQVAQSWGFGRDPSGAFKSTALPFPHRLFLLKIPAGLVMGFIITVFLLFLLQIHGFEWENQVILHGHAGFSSHPKEKTRGYFRCPRLSFSKVLEAQKVWIPMETGRYPEKTGHKNCRPEKYVKLWPKH